jgi:hypothetical protein
VNRDIHSHITEQKFQTKQACIDAATKYIICLNRKHNLFLNNYNINKQTGIALVECVDYNGAKVYFQLDVDDWDTNNLKNDIWSFQQLNDEPEPVLCNEHKEPLANKILGLTGSTKAVKTQVFMIDGDRFNYKRDNLTLTNNNRKLDKRNKTGCNGITVINKHGKQYVKVSFTDPVTQKRKSTSMSVPNGDVTYAIDRAIEYKYQKSKLNQL